MAFIDQFITPLVYDSDLLHLNSSTFWPDVLTPAIATTYPSMAMRMHVNSSSRPFFSAAQSSLVLTLPLALTFTVNDLETGFVDLLLCSCPLELYLEPSVSSSSSGSQRIAANISRFSCPVLVNKTGAAISSVSVAALQARVDKLLAFGVDYANSKYLNVGFEVPSIDISISGMKGVISLEDSVLEVMQTGVTPFIGFFTNISYSATAPARIQPQSRFTATVVALLQQLVFPRQASPATTPNKVCAPFAEIHDLQDCIQSPSRPIKSTKRAPPGWVAASKLSRANPNGNELSIVDFGAIPGAWDAAVTNALALNWAFGNATSGDTVVVPGGVGDFYMVRYATQQEHTHPVAVVCHTVVMVSNE